MHSASSSGTFGDEKDHVSTNYMDSSAKQSQWTTNGAKECNSDIEVSAEAQKSPIMVDSQESSNHSDPNNLVHPAPPDGGLQAWSQAVCGHLVSSRWHVIQFIFNVILHPRCTEFA